VLGVGLYVYPQYCKAELHTSALTGRAWVAELLTGHPDHIYIALGMRRHVFLALILQIRAMGHMESQNSRIMLEESVAIFLYTCVTGIAIDHVVEADLDRWIIDEQARDNSRGLRREEEIDFGSLATASCVSPAEKRHAENLRDTIAKDMWDGYVEYLTQRMEVDTDYFNDIQQAALD
jgi:hypothetical protein